jgi:hypothetical protein
MRVLILGAAFFLAMAGTDNAQAVTLKDCSKIKEPTQRMNCLEENIATLNKALGSELKSGDTVELRSFYAKGECATWLSSGAELKARPCNADPTNQFDIWTVNSRTSKPIPPAAPSPAPKPQPKKGSDGDPPQVGKH